MKKLRRHKKTIITTAILILLIIIIFSASAIAKKTVYQEFTCGCCEDSLQNSDCFLAGGMREHIDSLILKNFFIKGPIMSDAVKKLGISTLIDQDTEMKYRLKFLENPPKNTPNLTIKPEFVDIGTVNNSKGVIITDFTMTNNGEEDLIIYDIKTSCACLIASFIRGNDESLRAGRFSKSDGWTYTIKPKEKVLLRTFYDPRVTNWQTGHVERLVTITSNDPVFYQKNIKISAFLVD